MTVLTGHNARVHDSFRLSNNVSPDGTNGTAKRYDRDRGRERVSGLLLAAALSFLGVYASDYAWLEYRIGHDTAGQAFGSVTFYYATPLKNGRTEIFYDQPQTEICVQALFPHAGYRPCWYAARSLVRMVSLVRDSRSVS
jgi:hypothetical protein